MKVLLKEVIIDEDGRILARHRYETRVEGYKPEEKDTLIDNFLTLLCIDKDYTKLDKRRCYDQYGAMHIFYAIVSKEDAKYDIILRDNAERDVYVIKDVKSFDSKDMINFALDHVIRDPKTALNMRFYEDPENKLPKLDFVFTKEKSPVHMSLSVVKREA